MVSFALSEGVFTPSDLLVVSAVYDHITAEPWFSKGTVYRSAFAACVLARYRDGVVLTSRLYEECLSVAWEHFRCLKSDIEGFRFLLVEDDYLIAMEAAETLGALGAEVAGPVGTVAHAMDLVEHGPEIDGAILDVNLAGEMSYPVAALLKMKHIPFAFVSGYDEGVLPAFYRAELVCSKPTDWATVAKLVVLPAKAGAGALDLRTDLQFAS